MRPALHVSEPGIAGPSRTRANWRCGSGGGRCSWWRRRASGIRARRCRRLVAPPGFGYPGQALSSAEQVAAAFASARPGVDRLVCSPSHHIIGPFAAAAELGLLQVSGYGQNGSPAEAIGTRLRSVYER